MTKKISAVALVAFVACLWSFSGGIPRQSGLTVAGQPVTPPKEAPNEEYYEIVRTQQEDWGTLVTYVDKETRNGFLLTYDNNGRPVGTQALISVTGEPLRYDENGNLLNRLPQEQYKVEVPVVYGREESIPFSLSGSLGNVTGILATYGNASKIGANNYPEKEWITAYGMTTSNGCSGYDHIRHSCNRPVSTRTVSGMVEYLNTCPGCSYCRARCDTANLTLKVILKTETDPNTEWEVPRPWYEAEYAPDIKDDGKLDSDGNKIEYQPKAK